MDRPAEFRFDCPACEGDAKLVVDYKILRRTGSYGWLYTCHSCGGRDLLQRLADATRTAPADLLDGLVDLGPVRRTGTRNRADVAPEVPSEATFDGCASALWAAGKPMDYLTAERGISKNVIREFGVGWHSSSSRLVFPMRAGDEIAAYKTRAARPGAQMIKPSGSEVWSWPLYPEPDLDAEGVLLVAGDLDALRGRSAGLPAVSVTSGVCGWRDEWTEDLAGLRVVVCFDLGEGLRERRRVDELRAAGVDGHRLRLRRLLPSGARRKGTDLSDYLNGGGSVNRLRKLAGL